MSMRRAAWREPMVWLLLAIPAGAVVAGIGTMRVAGGGLDAAPDAVRRTAQAQVADLAPDARAAHLQLRATLRIADDGHVSVALPAPSRPHEVTLRFVHPTRAALDRRWTRTGAGEWIGPSATIDARGHWILEDVVAGWRLVGFQARGREVVLEPAVAMR
jgi:hypothetical protein